jgi:hypothetical protein
MILQHLVREPFDGDGQLLFVQNCFQSFRFGIKIHFTKLKKQADLLNLFSLKTPNSSKKDDVKADYQDRAYPKANPRPFNPVLLFVGIVDYIG